MGIPKFFRWLTRRYPMILHNVKQEEDLPQVDNFYMDLNGIVHNCIHGNDPKRHERISKCNDLEEVWASVMEAIDQLVHTVKPKQVLLLAVDGVAPRAKMNQQRARRFRSAKDAMALKAQLNAQGRNVPDLFDTNAISPGTPFMMELCRQLHFFVKLKVSTDPLYHGLQVIVSDGSVPGEGEHKMLDYIRQQRLLPTYNPNTRHCFYGADADLIMLSLLTHEPHFTIIREEHIVKKQKNGGVQRIELTHTNNFQLIYVSLLREYIQLEYQPVALKMKIKFDLERIIDDFIFFCFFIGNDFLPSLSALDIAEGSLDKLIDFYQKCLPQMTDYITDNGTIHWDRAEPFIWLLAEHEQEVFRGRIDQINDRRRAPKTIVVNSETTMMAGPSGASRTLTVQNAYKGQLFQKKADKVSKLQNKGETKKYKKYLIGKLFREDVDRMTQVRRTEYKNQLAKYKGRLEESKQETEPIDIWKQLDEGELSDLRPEEIPDECLSDVDNLLIDESLENSNNSKSDTLDGVASLQAGLDCDAEAENLKFMMEFVKLYAVDAKEAKKFYYNTKVHFDISTDEGKVLRKKMLKKYLEGMQWVLFYYYKGAQHWRWYYPYHYAPMITDLGMNIVNDFLGQTTISSFEIDYNCPENDRPYTPFQQLLCILPIRSFHLLPPEYLALTQGVLNEYFPLDFAVDLNGKTLAWEAIVLIPFVAEALFLAEESKLFQAGYKPTDADKIRNVAAFEIFSYNYRVQDNQPVKMLRSTLSNFKTPIRDLSQVTLLSEYEKVGSMNFESRLLKGVVHPSPGYPSFKYLNIIEMEQDYKVVQKVPFLRHMVKVPQALEETQPEILEDFIDKLCKKAKKEVFVDFPFQKEAFAMYFEDRFTIYTVFGDVQTNQFTVQKSPQFRSADEWFGHVNRTLVNLMDYGIFCPKSKVNVLVTCNRVENCPYDYESSTFYKVYQERPDVLPLSLLMRKIHPDHPLNVLDIRTSNLQEKEIQKGSEAVCLGLNLFGVVGKIESVHTKSHLIKIAIDKSVEEAKVHDPFLGQKMIKDIQAVKNKTDSEDRSKSFFGDQDLEAQLKLKGGVISRITSSFLISYKNPENGEKMVVDLGLNIKNFSKKVHVPQYVRFVSSGDHAVANEHDQWSHNKFARGANHTRQHWQYSYECVEIIKQYLENFPEVFEAVKKCGTGRAGPAVNKLRDVYGNETPATVAKLKQVLTWIEALPISSLPYVEMGFDALDSKMIASLNEHRLEIQTSYANVSLKARDVEALKSFSIFVERFPYWSSPFNPQQSRNFKVGHRVMNLNSTLRQYVPFGLRGTVVGRTEDKVIVMFDEQFIGGSDVFGHCELYRGAIINPNYLLNLTKKFESIMRKGQSNSNDVVRMFTEKAEGAEVAEAQKQEVKPKEPKEPKNPKKAKSNQLNAEEEAKTRQVYRVKPETQTEQPIQDPAVQVEIPQITFQNIPSALKQNKDFMELLGSDSSSANLMNPNASAFKPE